MVQMKLIWLLILVHFASGDDELVKKDIEAVVNAAKGKAIVKVIIETSLC